MSILTRIASAFTREPRVSPGPRPDWGRAGTQPKGGAGPKPRPNGAVVATKPALRITVHTGREDTSR